MYIEVIRFHYFIYYGSRLAPRRAFSKTTEELAQETTVQITFHLSKVEYLYWFELVELLTVTNRITTKKPIH